MVSSCGRVIFPKDAQSKETHGKQPSGFIADGPNFPVIRSSRSLLKVQVWRLSYSLQSPPPSPEISIHGLEGAPNSAPLIRS